MQKMQLFMIIVLSCTLMSGLISFGETYKPTKLYKFHHSYPRPARWQPFTKSLKYRPKRIIPQRYDVHEPDYERYAPIYEDSMDNAEYDKPYIIVIQFPQKREKNKHPLYQRQHIIDAPRSVDYINDDDDEVKVYDINNRTVRIKVNDRLSVLTS